MLKFLEKLRAFFFIIVVLAAMALCAVDLMKIQIVDGESSERRNSRRIGR